MMKYAILIGLTLGILWSCEEDDICLDGKTPQLFLKFENVFEADSARMDSIIIYRMNELDEYELVKALAKTNEIDSTKVSLRIDDVSQTSLIISPRRYETSKYDTLTLSYVRDLDYGSAACGYKVIYVDIDYDITDNFFVNKEVFDYNITNEEIPHILLYY